MTFGCFFLVVLSRSGQLDVGTPSGPGSKIQILHTILYSWLCVEPSKLQWNFRVGFCNLEWVIWWQAFTNPACARHFGTIICSEFNFYWRETSSKKVRNYGKGFPWSSRKKIVFLPTFLDFFNINFACCILMSARNRLKKKQNSPKMETSSLDLKTMQTDNK